MYTQVSTNLILVRELFLKVIPHVLLALVYSNFTPHTECIYVFSLVVTTNKYCPEHKLTDLHNTDAACCQG
jgi:hypothetical protein